MNKSEVVASIGGKLQARHNVANTHWTPLGLLGYQYEGYPVVIEHDIYDTKIEGNKLVTKSGKPVKDVNGYDVIVTKKFRKTLEYLYQFK